MKSIQLAMLLPVAMLTSNALANTLDGSLGTLASATDYYEVKCAKNSAGDTRYLQFFIKDLAPVATPTLNAQVSKGTKVLSTTDLIDGDTLYSTVVNANWGNGSYFIAVNKTSAGAELYNIKFTCMSAANKATSTTLATPTGQSKPAAWQNQ